MSSAVANPIPAAAAASSVKPREAAPRDDRDDFRAALKRARADAEAEDRATRKAGATKTEPPKSDPAPSPAETVPPPVPALVAATASDPAEPGAGEGDSPAPAALPVNFGSLLPDGPAVAPPTMRERSAEAPPPAGLVPALSASPAPIVAAAPPPSPALVNASPKPGGAAKATSAGSTAGTADAPAKGADVALAAVQGETTLSAEAVTAVVGGTDGFSGDPQTAGDGQADASPVPTGAPQAAPAPAGASSAAPAMAAAEAVRGSPETVQSLAAEMVRRLDQRVSRFEVALNPAGLGRVDVRLEIGAKGGLSARLSCDRAGSADELRARGGELASMLKDAGFDVAPDGLSFSFAEGGLAGGDLAGSAGGGGAFDAPPQPPAASGLRAFGAAAGAFDSLPPPSSGRAMRGLDIHV